MDENQFIKGFNSGYTLAKYEPSLLSKIITNLHPSNEYLEGFFSGKEELELENMRFQSEELKRLRTESKSRETDLERET